MPRCELTKAAVGRIKGTAHIKRTIYMDADIPGFLLEYRPNGAGTWYFRIRKKLKKQKLIRIGSLAEMDVLEARVRAYEIHKFVESGGSLETLDVRSGNRLTFSAFIHEHYMPHAKSRKRSWKAEQGILRRDILPELGEMPLGTITRLTLVHWQEGMLGRGLAPSTCNRALFLLKYALNCARRWGFISDSPARDVQALPEKEFRERYLSEDEARRLLEVLKEEKDQQVVQVIRLLLFTGARKSEILAARWENVDLVRRILTVPLSKSGKARHIPLSDAALQVLTDLPRRSEWLFPSSRTAGHITSVFTIWDRVRTKAGLKDVRLHDLRHSFASFLVNDGCTLYEVQRILGHHDPKVTTRYAHLAQDSLLKAASIVGRRLG